MQQAGVQAPCDQQSAAVVVVAAAAAGGDEEGDDEDRVMLAGDEAAETDVDVAVWVCSILWCCCERTRVAESEACPGRTVFPAQQSQRLY